MAERETEVFVPMAEDDVLAGRLWTHRRRDRESASFTYDPSYLARPGAYALDPGLPLDSAQAQTAAGQSMFGAFSDCAPDRWGRHLIERTERLRARSDGDAERSFGEIDFLLGVSDLLRQGALRFRDPATGAFLDPDQEVPPLRRLPELLRAADAVERNVASEDDLATLLRGGTSPGGARPKVHVADEDGRMAIAKFPSPANDDWDVIRWEAVALQLARNAGIAVSDWTLHLVGEAAVLIVRRFDRSGARRVGYVSAMTMLEAFDGDQSTYPQLAEMIEEHGADPVADLAQLWRRMAFTVLVSNTDDHLRNHGFLRTSSAGWSLSPAFDLNPDPRRGPKRLRTGLDTGRFDADLGVAMEVAPLFRLGDGQARRILGEVATATAQWRAVARTAGLADAAIDEMAPAFEHPGAHDARAGRESVARPLRPRTS